MKNRLKYIGHLDRIACGLLLGLLCPLSGSPQGPDPGASPQEVLREYRKIDAAGQRLTEPGWYSAAKFFVKPATPPQRRAFAVIESEVSTYRTSIDGNRATISFRCSAIGQVDSSGRFTTLVAPLLIVASHQSATEHAAPPVHGPVALAREYDLVLGNIYWEFGPDGKDLREVTGQSQWRIETFEAEPWVYAAAAIRYLTKLHDESANSSIKSNAAASIVAINTLCDRK